MSNAGSSRRSDPVRLVRAARELFLRYGFRRTSMDDVAKEADVAKGTVYLAFKSKDELMRGVCVDLCDELTLVATEAAAGLEDPLERVRARLVAKYLRTHELVYLSPHATELMMSKDEVASEVVKTSDVKFRRVLANDLEKAASLGSIDFARFDLDAVQAAALAMRLARSCSLPDEGAAAPTVGAVKKRLHLTLDLFFAGLKTGV